MKSAQIMNRIKLASLVALGLVFPSSGQAQTVARPASGATYAQSQVPRADFRPQGYSQNSSVSNTKSPSRVAMPSRSPVQVVQQPTWNEGATSAAYGNSEFDHSHVEQAGCASCQSGGVDHAHSSTVEHVDSGIYYDEASSIPYATGIARPGAYRFSGGACGDVCADPAVGLLSAILLNSQVRVAAATFWGDGQNVLPLVTTSAQNPINLDTAGSLADGLRRDLFGGSEMLTDGVQGIRGEIGLFTDACRTGGLMLRLFDTGNNEESYHSVPGTNGFIARPFRDGTTPETLVINHGTQAIGSVSAAINSDAYGGDILLRRAFHQEQLARFEWLLGYQMMRLEEGLYVDSSTSQNGVSARVRDSFATSNQFHGAAIGMNMHLSDQCWSFNTMLKLGIGNNDREVNIDGSTTFSGAQNSTSPNGLLARQTNAGTYTSSEMVAVPEIAMNLGYKITPQLEAVVGYSFLTLPKSVQVANQIDPELRSDLTAGGPAPRFNLVESHYSLHSLSYGVQFRY